MEVIHMSKNSQNFVQNEDNFTAGNEEKLISDLNLIKLKTGTDKDIQDLKKTVSGDTVKKAVDELVLNINTQLIGSLNTKLGEEQAKVKSLEDIIGNDDAGLKKNLIELAGKVNNMLPEEAPTHPDIL